MKTLYKNSTTYSKESLSEAYKTLTWPIGMAACGIVVILWLICTFLCENLEEFVFVGSMFFILFISYVVLFFLWMHKLYANNEVKRYNVLYRSNQVERDVEFNEEEIKIHNLSTGWLITLNYNQFVKIKENMNYFILCFWPRRLFMFLIIDKSWFSKWNPKTFKEFITSKIKSNQELKKPEQSKKAK